MAHLRILVDTRHSELGFLAPADLEVVSAFIDLFYLVCLKRGDDERDFEGGRYLQKSSSRSSSFAKRRIPLSEYDVQIEFIEFYNPLEIGAFFRNVSTRTAGWVLDRTLFYQQEKERRQIENEVARQRLIDLKMKNAAKAVETRKKLIKGGLSEEDATKVLGSLLYDQRASVRLDSSQERQ